MLYCAILIVQYRNKTIEYFNNVKNYMKTTENKLIPVKNSENSNYSGNSIGLTELIIIEESDIEKIVLVESLDGAEKWDRTCNNHNNSNINSNQNLGSESLLKGYSALASDLDFEYIFKN